MKNLKVALAHDYFLDYGGAERVVETLHEMFPDAPVYTAFTDPDALGPQWNRFKNWDIRTSWAQNIPFIKQLSSPLRVLADKFFGSFDFSKYDLVISSTNMYMAKSIHTKHPTIHLCYCHTPPRSLYGYTTMTDWKKNPIIRVVGSLINHYMRIVDFKTAQYPDVFIANSKEVQKRIEKFYRRESVVIYPPINVPPELVKEPKEDFILFVGRLAMSKHVDLVIQACNELKRKLIVVGTGKNLAYLQGLAGETVEFAGSVSDEMLASLYARAKLLVYPAEDEDFGMIAVEAMAYGTPAIVHRSGGFLESVVEDKTGVFINDLTVDGVTTAIKIAEKISWNARAIYEHAKTFSSERFKKQIAKLVEDSTKDSAVKGPRRLLA